VVLAALLVGLVAVVAAAVFCVVRGLALWRQIKRTGRSFGAEMTAFEERTARTETLLAQADHRSDELDAALERLRTSRARLQVLRDALESAKARVRWFRAFLPI
jgi:biopolymer transport protein ExbB/TolQ